jgi:hypothetical protein
MVLSGKPKGAINSKRTAQVKSGGLEFMGEHRQPEVLNQRECIDHYFIFITTKVTASACGRPPAHSFLFFAELTSPVSGAQGVNEKGSGEIPSPFFTFRPTTALLIG